MTLRAGQHALREYIDFAHAAPMTESSDALLLTDVDGLAP